MQDELHALYMSVYGRAGFRLGCLQKEDFALLKEEMGEGFQLWVATLEGRIIGFHCGMCDGQDVEAYFVGFEGITTSLTHSISACCWNSSSGACAKDVVVSIWVVPRSTSRRHLGLSHSDWSCMSG